MSIQRGDNLVMLRSSIPLNQLGEREPTRRRSSIWPAEEPDDSNFYPATIRELYPCDRGSVLAARLRNEGYSLETPIMVASIKAGVIVRVGRREYITKGHAYDVRRIG
jgi:hypothetical protein